MCCRLILSVLYPESKRQVQLLKKMKVENVTNIFKIVCVLEERIISLCSKL